MVIKHHRARPLRPMLLLVSAIMSTTIGLVGVAAPSHAAAATIKLNATSWSAGARLSSTAITVTTSDQATWTATSSAPTWLLANPTGPTVVSVTALANPGAARSATVTFKSASGRNVKLTVKQAKASTKLSYVALGDSYSTGQGVLIADLKGIRFDTDNGQFGDCGQGRSAYPKLLAADKSFQLTLADFKACSGATTADVTRRAQNKANGVQVAALSDKTDIVSLTIGGNDIGFGDILTLCIFVNCTPKSLPVLLALNAIERLTPALTTTYQTVLDKAPNATVYVVGYPQLGPPAGSPMCLPLGSVSAKVAIEDANSMRQVGEALNARIAQAVSEVGDPRLVFVDAAGPKSPFAGHDMCARVPYVQSLVVVPLWADATQASFHPNKAGNDAYVKLVSAALKS